MSRPFLVSALQGRDQLLQLMERTIKEFKISMFLTGSRQVSDLANAPLVLGPPTIINWLSQRGIRCR